MARYIDADKLKPKTERWLEMDDYDHEREYCMSYYPLSEIDNAPTEEVQPIVRGKWLNVSKVVHDDYLGDVNYAECSVCHSIRVADYFCSCCGADMRKMVESEKGE